MEIQLDPVGGIAGDMFIAALTDAFPEHEAGLRQAIATLALPGLAGCEFYVERNGGLQGRRFLVKDAPSRAEIDGTVSGEAHGHRHPESANHPHPHPHGALGHGGDEHAPSGHAHVGWREIRERIETASLSVEVKRHALGIFGLLAEAEARVHGIPEAEVAFHEVGATDSIADVVGAAYLIAAVGATDWSVGPLPLGGGTILTAHGRLPVPAPATARLLEGFDVHDDGVPGERVTPTGAAILRHLRCRRVGEARPARTLSRSGLGLGARRLPGMSNCLRVLVFSETPVVRESPAEAEGHKGSRTARRELAVLEFDVDDQTPEDLATALDHLRLEPGVLDVAQGNTIGKQGRQTAHVRILARPETVEALAERCFQETTTIGCRYSVVQGLVLPRRETTVDVEGRTVGVKVVSRPGSKRTAKAEMRDVASFDGGQAHRDEIGRQAVERALAQSDHRPEPVSPARSANGDGGVEF